MYAPMYRCNCYFFVFMFQTHGCGGWQFIGDCSDQHVFSAIYFAIQALCLLISSVLIWVLLWNMKFEVG